MDFFQLIWANITAKRSIVAVMVFSIYGTVFLIFSFRSYNSIVFAKKPTFYSMLKRQNGFKQNNGSNYIKVVKSSTIFPNQNYDCLSPIENYLRSKTEDDNLSILQTTYSWDTLWLTEKLAPSLLDSDGFLKLENRKALNKTELQLTVQSMYPASKHEFFHQTGCQKCVVVGSGGCLRGKNLGNFIDQFPVVIRLNSGPLQGFEETVGSKTDIRVLYPESAPTTKDFYEGEGFVVVVPYKRDDFLWAASMANSSLNLKLTDFWRAIPAELPVVDAKKIVVINPNIPEALFKELKTEKRENGARATTGSVAIFMALHLCQSVSVAGFCYNFNSTNAFGYYYGKQKVRDILKRGPHAKEAENRLRTNLLELQLLTDLTKSMK